MPGNDRGGVLTDITKYGTDAVLTNMEASDRIGASSDRPGGHGALDFDGDNEYLDLGTIGTGHPLQLDTGALTISAWFLHRDGGDDFARIIDKSTAGNGAGGWGVYLNNTVRKPVFVSAGQDDVIDTSDASYEFDTWTHIVVTYTVAQNLGLRRIFIDGVNVRLSDKNVTIPTASTNARIGTWNHSTGREFDGFLDDIRVWNLTLSQAEAIDVYQLSKRFNPGLMNRLYSPVIGVSAATADITGDATDTIDEADIVSGGKKIIITLIGDTWEAAGTGPIGTLSVSQEIIDGLVSAQSEGTGWNTEVRDNLDPGVDLVRTSNTVATITLPAEAAYDITAQETITDTVPANALVLSGSAIVATPTFTVDEVSAAALPKGSLALLGVGV